MYYTYMLRCQDNSIYTGMASDINRRMEEHFNKTDKCAKYTKRHTAKKLEAAWQSNNRALACKLEFHIKALPKANKEKIINGNKEVFSLLLKDKVDVDEYTRCKLSI